MIGQAALVVLGAASSGACWAWRALLHLHRRNGHDRLLSLAGVVFLVSTVLIRVGMVWTGSASARPSRR